MIIIISNLVIKNKNLKIIKDKKNNFKVYLNYQEFIKI